MFLFSDKCESENLIVRIFMCPIFLMSELFICPKCPKKIYGVSLFLINNVLPTLL